MIGIGISPFIRRALNSIDSTIILWLDATLGKTGNPISTWADQTSNANDGVQAVAGARPTDNATFVYFAGDDNMDCGNNASLSPTSKLTLYAKIQTSSGTIFMGLFDKYVGSTSGYVLFLNGSQVPSVSAQCLKTAISVTASTAVNDNTIRKVHATIECTRKFSNKQLICNGRQPQIYKEGATYYLFYDRWDGSQDNIYVRSSTSYDFSGSSETLLISNRHYCSILKDGSTYRLVVADAANQNLILYTSAAVDSGYSSQGTLVTYGAAYDANAVADPKEIKIGSTYFLYYSSFSAPGVATIAYATSSTGASGSYTKNGTCIGVGAGSDFDLNLVADPSISVLQDGSYIMLYTGYNSTYTKQQQGYATSSDGITWTKFANNPIHYFSDPSFESGTQGPNEPDAIFENGKMRMYYTSNNVTSASCQIGYTDFELDVNGLPVCGSETITTKIYVNNVLENTDTKTGVLGIDYIVPSAQRLMLAGDGVSTFLFAGNIYEAKIFNSIQVTV